MVASAVWLVSRSTTNYKAVTQYNSHPTRLRVCCPVQAVRRACSLVVVHNYSSVFRSKSYDRMDKFLVKRRRTETSNAEQHQSAAHRVTVVADVHVAADVNAEHWTSPELPKEEWYVQCIDLYYLIMHLQHAICVA